MNQITIMSTAWMDADACTQWEAQYEVSICENVSVVVIYTGYGWLEIVVAKHDNGDRSDCTYYIAVLDEHVAACRVPGLDDPDHVTEQLLIAGLSTRDAVTVAQILSAIGEEESDHV